MLNENEGSNHRLQCVGGNGGRKNTNTNAFLNRAAKKMKMRAASDGLQCMVRNGRRKTQRKEFDEEGCWEIQKIGPCLALSKPG